MDKYSLSELAQAFRQLAYESSPTLAFYFHKIAEILEQASENE